MTDELWSFLLPGYLVTVAIELPVLWFGLARRHRASTRLWAGFWLTGSTYPIVVLVLPMLIDPAAHRHWYLAVAETFAPMAECLLFHFAVDRRMPAEPGTTLRDSAAIVIANLASFGVGEASYAWLR